METNRSRIVQILLHPELYSIHCRIPSPVMIATIRQVLFSGPNSVKSPSHSSILESASSFGSPVFASNSYSQIIFSSSDKSGIGSMYLILSSVKAPFSSKNSATAHSLSVVLIFATSPTFWLHACSLFLRTGLVIVLQEINLVTQCVLRDTFFRGYTRQHHHLTQVFGTQK